MGIGLIVICSRQDVDRVIAILERETACFGAVISDVVRY